MDRLLTILDEVLAGRFGGHDWTALAPDEMQGYAGVLRGTFRSISMTVRMVIEPWDPGERWQAMAKGRRLGETAFWNDWFPQSTLCRIPFLTDDFTSQCSVCGDEPCWHAGALTRHWLNRAAERPELLLLLLNRRGLIRTPNLNARAISRVPLGLGTNLDRTKRELQAILESALKAASFERDNLFGGGADADSHNRG